MHWRNRGQGRQHPLGDSIVDVDLATSFALFASVDSQWPAKTGREQGYRFRPAVLFPYDKMGKSASGIACDASDGKFGPFAGQLFVGDQSHSTIMRVFLEKIDGIFPHCRLT